MQVGNSVGKTMLDFTKKLDQKGKIVAEYIWIDGAQIMRSKSRTLPEKITSVDQLPEWNYDGSSCYQATTENSEIIMKPVAFYPDPFRLGDNIMVLCETFQWEDTTYQKLIPSNSNFRHHAQKIWATTEAEEPWYGIEQEYTMLEEKNRFTCHPYGWPKAGFPG